MQKNKIIVRLNGGLGNQMFQYAAGVALAERLGYELLLDTRLFDEHKLREFGLAKFRIRAGIASKEDLFLFPKFMRRIYKILSFVGLPKVWFIEDSDTHAEFKFLNRGCLIEGYFQSERFFFGVADNLRQDFILVDEINDKNKLILEKIKKHESVMVHVRRGDYLSNPVNLSIHGICDVNYYEKACSAIVNRIRDPYFFVFSDDMKWVKENIFFGENVFYIDGNESHPEIDLYLMSQCNHHIIANSTFSWWGAWLSGNCNKIVIAPEKWFVAESISSKSIVPPQWIRM